MTSTIRSKSNNCLARPFLTLLCAALLLAPAAAEPPQPPPAGGSATMESDAAASPKDYGFNGALDLVGLVSYQFASPTGPVTLYFERLENDSFTHFSGTIRVGLILTTAPITGAFSYWTIASFQLDSLLPNYYYGEVTRVVDYVPPPDGIYYVHFAAFEYENNCGSTSGYCSDDIRSFANRVQVVGGQLYAYSGPANPATSTAVEYYNAGLGHYFVTAIPGEISALDLGVIPGWIRTGQSFGVWSGPGAGLFEVCRFFSAYFAPKSSHFYTALGSECAGLKLNPVWQYEGIVAYVALPSGAGACSTGIPLYRLYNNVLSGAPNHRYTTSAAIRAQMIAQGWTSEGYGTNGVISCVPF